MTSSRSLTRAAALSSVGVVAALAFTTHGSRAQTSSAVGGRTYAAFVRTAAASLPESPLAVLDPAAGMADAEAASLSVPGVLVAKGVTAATTGVVGENAASAQSTASGSDVNILNGVITAKAILAIASSVSNGVQAQSNAAGSTLVDLMINGVPFGVGAPAPNTRIELPGLGAVILNEQIASGNGLTTTGLTVNMIHVLLQDAVTGAHIGDVIVASSTSEAAFGR